MTSGDASPWNLVRVEPAASAIVSQVRDRVLQRRSKSGELLGSEKGLAEQFGVSRPTIREAVKSLEAQGVVAVERGGRGGIRIAPTRLDRVTQAVAVQLALMETGWSELLGAQVALEVQTARAAARAATESDIARLSSLQDACRRAKSEDHAEFVNWAVEFHVAVGEATHNRVLGLLLSALSGVIKGYYLSISQELSEEENEARFDAVLDQHGLLLEAITAGDADLAARVMEAHLGETHQKLPETWPE